MRTALILGLLVAGCSKPTDCTFHRTEPARVAVRMWVPERDVYQCANNVWIYKQRN